MAEAPRRHADAQSEQGDVTHRAEYEASVYNEQFAELTGAEAIEYQTSAADSMVQAVAEGECGIEPDSAEVLEDDQ